LTTFALQALPCIPLRGAWHSHQALFLSWFPLLRVLLDIGCPPLIFHVTCEFFLFAAPA